MPAVMVITAAYNSSRTLKCALASLCDQTFEGFEAWVVGDSCRDDSERVVRGFRDERFNWVNLPEHAGTQSAPNNKGLRRAGGHYIWDRMICGCPGIWRLWSQPSNLGPLTSYMQSQYGLVPTARCGRWVCSGSNAHMPPFHSSFKLVASARDRRHVRTMARYARANWWT
jgi:glycosyltransferase involved in cell wall biosynthesis